MGCHPSHWLHIFQRGGSTTNQMTTMETQWTIFTHPKQTLRLRGRNIISTVSIIFYHDIWYTGWWFGTMEFYDFPYIGKFIIPTDEVHHFSEGRAQPPIRYILIYVYISQRIPVISPWFWHIRRTWRMSSTWCCSWSCRWGNPCGITIGVSENGGTRNGWLGVLWLWKPPFNFTCRSCGGDLNVTCFETTSNYSQMKTKNMINMDEP